MNKSTLLFTFLFISTFSLFAQWTEQTSGTTYEIRSIFFTDENKGFAVAMDTTTYDGQLLQTTDGGDTWSEHSISSNPEFVAPLDIVFTSSTVGIISGAGTRNIWRTTDGGATWSDMHGASGEIMWDIEFPSANIGYAAGASFDASEQGIIIKTTDGGLTWNYLTYPTPGNKTPKCIKCVSETDCFMGSNDTLWRTTDGGANWNAITLDGCDYWDFDFLDNSNGFVAGGYNQGEAIYKTTNGGSSWSEVFRRTGERLLCIKFANATNGWACGENGKLLKTTDGGATWTDEILSSASSFNELFFVSENYGFMVGSGGAIYRMGQASGLADRKSNDMVRVYPSPCTDQLHFDLGTQNVSGEIKICDILGNTVYSQIFTEGNAKINTSSFPEGLYFYTISGRTSELKSGKFIKK